MDGSSSNPSPQDTGGSQIIRRLALLLYLAYLLWGLWLMLPPHQQTAFRLRLLRWSTQVMSGLARRTGAASLAHEARTGAQSYGVPYQLGRAALASERAYERARAGLS